MSSEGVTLVENAALALFLIVTAATFRTLMGPGRRSHLAMTAGTLGGIAFGVLVSAPISRWFGTDTSAICACLGMVLGWAVAWWFGRATLSFFPPGRRSSVGRAADS